MTQILVGDPRPARKGSARDELVQAALKRERAQRLKMPGRTTAEMIDAVAVELNRQLDPLLKASELRDLTGDELDRMIRISTATLAIHRAAGGMVDPGEMTDDELRKAAGKR